MNVPASAGKLASRPPSDRDRASANHLRRIIAAGAAGGQQQTLGVIGPTGQRADIVLTPVMSHILMEVLRHVGAGDAVTLVPVTRMLTTQQAADILNVSRPYLISLLEDGRIAHTLVGRHRRITADDLFAYKDRRDAARASALSALAAEDAALI